MIPRDMYKQGQTILKTIPGGDHIFLLPPSPFLFFPPTLQNILAVYPESKGVINNNPDNRLVVIN